MARRPRGAAADGDLPPFLLLALEQRQSLRYGENPDQQAAFYVTGERGGLADLTQLGGKELSFNNLLDLDAACFALEPWPDEVACVIIKHTTPCGIALGKTPLEAYRRALATDPVSAYGSVVGFNTIVDAETATAMSDLFVEAVVAPRFQPDALEVLRRKKNLRIVEVPRRRLENALDFKRVRSGFLAETQMRFDPDERAGRSRPSARRPPRRWTTCGSRGRR